MGLWNIMKRMIAPTTKSAIGSKRKKIARIEGRQLKSEERISDLRGKLKKSSNPGTQRKLEAEEARLVRLELEEEAHAVQLMNGLNAQIQTLKRAAENLDQSLVLYNTDFQPVHSTMNDIRLLFANPRSNKYLLNEDRLKSLLALAITDKPGELREALKTHAGIEKRNGRKITSAAGAQKLIEDDIRFFRSAMETLGTGQVHMDKLKARINAADRKFELINGLIHGILNELEMLGHDFVPKIAAVKQRGREYQAEVERRVASAGNMFNPRF